MAKLKMKVQPRAMQVLLWAVAILAVVDALSKFNIVDLTGIVSPIFLPTVASLFLLFDIAIVQILRGRKKLDVVDSVTLVVAVIGLIGVLATIFGLVNPTLTTLLGVVSLILGVVVVVNIFKK